MFYYFIQIEHKAAEIPFYFLYPISQAYDMSPESYPQFKKDRTQEYPMYGLYF